MDVYEHPADLLMPSSSQLGTMDSQTKSFGMKVQSDDPIYASMKWSFVVYCPAAGLITAQGDLPVFHTQRDQQKKCSKYVVPTENIEQMETCRLKLVYGSKTQTITGVVLQGDVSKDDFEDEGSDSLEDVRTMADDDQLSTGPKETPLPFL